MMSLKIFVDTAPDVRFIRRLQRDMAERGRNADVLLPHGANGPAVDIITTKVSSLIRDLKPA
jgi:uridine kinase